MQLDVIHLKEKEFFFLKFLSFEINSLENIIFLIKEKRDREFYIEKLQQRTIERELVLMTIKELYNLPTFTKWRLNYLTGEFEYEKKSV